MHQLIDYTRRETGAVTCRPADRPPYSSTSFLDLLQDVARIDIAPHEILLSAEIALCYGAALVSSGTCRRGNRISKFSRTLQVRLSPTTTRKCSNRWRIKAQSVQARKPYTSDRHQQLRRHHLAWCRYTGRRWSRVQRIRVGTRRNEGYDCRANVEWSRLGQDKLHS